MMPRPAVRWIAALFFGTLSLCYAQQQPIGVPVPPLGAGPFVLDTAEQHKIRVNVVARGLSHPWAIAFLPDGAMLAGADGLLYLLTDEDDGALLRIEPAQ